MLFPCPEEGCGKAYSLFANLQTPRYWETPKDARTENSPLQS